MESNTLEIVIKAIDDASKTLEKVKGSLGDLGEETKSLQKNSDGLSKMMAGSFKNATIISAAGIAAVTAEIFLAVKAFSDSEAVMAQTEAVLKSTGGVAGVTADQVAELAKQYSHTTMFEDEMIQSAENMLLTFSGITKETFPDATSAVLNLGTAMHGDLQGATIQLGKALNDPIKGLSALTRNGVVFTDSQIALIESLVNSGQKMEAQKMILKELQTEFGGSAEAAGKTFAGQLTILKNEFGNVQEVIGKFIADRLRPLIENAVKFVGILEEWSSGNINLADTQKRLTEEYGLFGTVIGQTAQFLNENKIVLYALAGALGGILVIALAAATVAMAGFIGLSLPVLAIAAAIGAAIAGAAYLIYSNWETIGPIVSTAIANIVAAFQIASAWFMTNVVPVLQAIWAEFQKFWTEIEPSFRIAMENIKVIVETLFAFLHPAIVVFVEFFKNEFEGLKLVLGVIWEVIKMMVRTAWSFIEGFIKIGLALFVGDWSGAWTAVKDMFVSQWTFMKDFIKSIWDQIKDYIAYSINQVIGLINSMIDNINKLQIDGKGFNVGKIGAVSFDTGGWVTNSGLANIHQGEFVLSRDMLAGKQTVPATVNTNSNSNNRQITVNTYGSETNPFELAALIGFELDIRGRY